MSFIGVERGTNSVIFITDDCSKVYVDKKDGVYKECIDKNVYDGFFDKINNIFYPKYLDLEVFNYYGDVPVDIIQTRDKWCYNELEGFYINPEWRNDDVTDVALNISIMDAIEELAFKVSDIEGRI